MLALWSLEIKDSQTQIKVKGKRGERSHQTLTTSQTEQFWCQPFDQQKRKSYLILIATKADVKQKTRHIIVQSGHTDLDPSKFNLLV